MSKRDWPDRTIRVATAAAVNAWLPAAAWFDTWVAAPMELMTGRMPSLPATREVLRTSYAIWDRPRVEPNPDTKPYCGGPDTPQVPPPYDFLGLKEHAYPLKARRSVLRELCDRFLNRPLGGDANWRPMAGLVYANVLYYPEMRAVREPWASMGYDTQHEFYIAIPVMGGPGPIPTQWGLFVPACWVDSPNSVIVGREMAGYPKQLGRFVQKAEQDMPSIVEGRVYPSKGAEMEWRPIVGFETSLSAAAASGPVGADGRGGARTPDQADTESVVEPGDISHPLGPIRHLFAEDAHADVDVDEDVEHLLDDLASAISFSAIQCKELRAMVEAERACFQAVVHARMQMSNLGGQGLLGPSRVQFWSYPGLDLEQMFGIESREAILPFELTTDLRYDHAIDEG